MKVKRLRAPRLLTLGMGGGEDLVTLGTDFSGMGGGEACFAKLSVNYALIFSCDNSSACEKLLKHKYKPKVFFPDILLRKPEEEQYVDAYVWAAPCQPYSSAGKQQGSADARGGPMMDAAVGFIRRQRPRLTVMENVKGFANKKFRPVLNKLVADLKSFGYIVKVALLNTKSYGVPQDRKRIYLVAIRRDSAHRVFHWPKPLGDPLPMDHFLDPATPTDKAGRLPTADAAKKLVKQAYAKAWKKGVNPLEVPVFVDVDCSQRFSVSGIGEAKTITRGRGAAGGPWVSTRGRRTTIRELFRLQGYNPSDFRWKAAGVSKPQMGAMIGNAMSLTVSAPVIAEGLWAAGLVSVKPSL